MVTKKEHYQKLYQILQNDGAGKHDDKNIQELLHFIEYEIDLLERTFPKKKTLIRINGNKRGSNYAVPWII